MAIRMRAMDGLFERSLSTMLGLVAASAAVALMQLDVKFRLAALCALLGVAAIVQLRSTRRLKPLLALGLVVGLTVKLDVSFFQQYEAIGNYVPNVGGAAGITLSICLVDALVLLAVQAIDRPSTRPFWRAAMPLALAQLAFMACGLVSMAEARDTALAGFEQLRCLHYVIVFIALSAADDETIEWFVLALPLGITVQSAMAVAQFVSGTNLGLDVLGDQGPTTESIDFAERFRGSGFKVHPNILSYYYEILYPLCLAVALSRGARRLRLAGATGALAALVGVLTTLTRAAWLTIPISTLVVAAVVFRDRWRRPRSLAFIAALGLAGLVALAFVGPLIAERLFADDGGSAGQRGPLDTAAIDLIRRFPLFGVGLNNFPNTFPVFDLSGVSQMPVLFAHANHVVHNMHLLVMAEVGLIGYAAFIAVFLIAIVMAFRLARRAAPGDPRAAIAVGAATGLFAHLQHGLVDPGYRLNLGIGELVFVCIGLIAACRANASQEVRR